MGPFWIIYGLCLFLVLNFMFFYYITVQLLVDFGPHKLEDKHAYFASCPLHFLQSSWRNFRLSEVTVTLVSSYFYCFSWWLSNVNDIVFFLILLRGDAGKWIAFVAVVLRLFFPRHFPGNKHGVLCLVFHNLLFSNLMFCMIKHCFSICEIQSESGTKPSL